MLYVNHTHRFVGRQVKTEKISLTGISYIVYRMWTLVAHCGFLIRKN